MRCSVPIALIASVCTVVLKESIAYYINNGNSVYCTFLDASKAFDRVEYIVSFFAF